MAPRAQSRFDNPRGSRNPPALLTATEAIALLGVKRATLYSYASRGWVRAFPNPSGQGNLYDAEDLARLRQRRNARSGHGPVAAGALSYGEPILETAICRIDAATGPLYRGRSAIALAAAGARFESVCEWLWTGAEIADPRWPALGSRPPPRENRSAFGSMLLAAAEASDEAAPDDPRAALALLAAAPRRATSLGAVADASVASTLAAALDPEGSARPSWTPALEAALILSADHELTASTFAARIAASTGASLWACLTAGLATLSGPRHGSAPPLVSAFLAALKGPRAAASLVSETLRQRRPIPGFGHPLYPEGDPRAAALWALALEAAPRRLAKVTSRAMPPEPLAKFEALAKAVAVATGERPSLDFGLAALTAAHGLPPETATAIFALGRSAGLIAHVLEQRQDGRLLRPRARYVGPQ